MKPRAIKKTRRSGITRAQLRDIALSFPGSSEGTSYGKPSFLIGGKFFTRLRSEDDSVVLIVGSIDERDMLLESEPKLFHITDHYRNYPAILARMSILDTATLRSMLDRRWRAIAPKKFVKQGAKAKLRAKPPSRRKKENSQ
jgi:hypothetical protein